MEQNPAKLLKEDAEVLAFPLSNIKKLSINSQLFQMIIKLLNQMLYSKITHPKIYRLNLFLPVVSNIIEKSIHFQMED